MSDTCIICGLPAGSREHIFPAALGGRRTNKGIYCGDHNEGFSPLAAVMTEQLRTINALLSVRHDRKRKAEPQEYTSPEGEALKVFDGKVTRSRLAADESAPMHIELGIGGSEGLKAAAYVALTFFAHHFPQHARKAGLAPLKDYTRGLIQGDFAWWEAENVLAALPNSFDFGHTIVLTTSAATGAATAIVSLFGAFNFGIALGKLDGLSDETVIVFIDPQAEHPPNDIVEKRTAATLYVAEKPAPLNKHLGDLAANGGGQRLLQRLFEKIEHWHFAKTMTPLLAQINALKADDPASRSVKIASLLQGQIGVIHAVVKQNAEMLLKEHTGKPDFDKLAPAIREMTVYNDPPAPSFTLIGQNVVLEALISIAGKLNNQLSAATIDADALWGVLRGPEACTAIGKIMLAHAVKAARTEPQTS